MEEAGLLSMEEQAKGPRAPRPRAPWLRLLPALAALAALALAGVLLVQVQRATPGRAQLQGATVLDEEEDDGEDGGEDGEYAQEAVGRHDWTANHDNCMDVRVGRIYYVLARANAGWIYAMTQDESEEGYVPDTHLYHGKGVIAVKDHKTDKFSLKKGDTVWELHRHKTEKGHDWVYVIFGSQVDWVPMDVLQLKADKKSRSDAEVAFVRKDYSSDLHAHIALKKGEVVWAAERGPDWNFIRVEKLEGDDMKTGWVNRSHLLEAPAVSVLRDFAEGDEKELSKELPAVGKSQPKGYLYVEKGDTVWLDDAVSNDDWVYAYHSEEEGFLPKAVLTEAEVDGKTEEIDPGAAPKEEAPEEPEEGEEGDDKEDDEEEEGEEEEEEEAEEENSDD